jgi:hypothetical protein
MKINAMIFLGSIFWFLGSFLTNNSEELVKNTLPVILAIISFWFYKKGNTLFPLPILLIPIINTKLALFPFLALGSLFLTKPKTSNPLMKVFVLTSLIIFLFNIKIFFQQSIFKPDYEARQEVLRNIHLYPNPTMARVYQNKARIITDKFADNFLALIDPGNYFFSFHPREDILINRNLVKYPFMTIIPVLIGILEFKKIKNSKFIIAILTASIFSLSFVEIFDGSDFILWLPITLLFIHGVKIIYKSKYIFLPFMFSVFFIINCLIELVRIFFIY